MSMTASMQAMNTSMSALDRERENSYASLNYAAAINSASYDSTEHDALYQHFQPARYQCLPSQYIFNSSHQYDPFYQPILPSYPSIPLIRYIFSIHHIATLTKLSLFTSESSVTVSGSYHPGGISTPGPSLMSSHVTVTHIPQAYNSTFHSNTTTTNNNHHNNNNIGNNNTTINVRKPKNSQGFYDTSAMHSQDESPSLNPEGGYGGDPRGGTASLKEENIFQRQLLRKMMFHSTAQGVRNGKAILHQVHLHVHGVQRFVLSYIHSLY